MIFFVADMFANQYEGGAELTTEAIISDSLFPGSKINSQSPNLLELMKVKKDAFWIFGNYASVPEKCLLYAAKNLNYSTKDLMKTAQKKDGKSYKDVLDRISVGIGVLKGYLNIKR